MTPEIFTGIPYHQRIEYRKALHIMNREPKDPRKLDLIIDEICKYFELDVERFKAGGRLQKYAHGRFYYFYMCRLLTDEPLMAIGSKVGRNHTSVLHGIKQVENWSEYEKQVRKNIDELTKRITR